MSMNDPGWGRDPSGDKESKNPRSHDDRDRQPNKEPAGPPDLDELWRDFNQRMGRLFGKNGGGRGSSLPPSSGPSNPGRLFGFAAAAGVALWLASGFFIVQEGQEAVILQFGKYHHTATPGFQWRFPEPIQRAFVINSSQVRTVEVGYRNDVRNKMLKESLMLTDDENIIDIQFAVQFRVKNAADYLFYNQEPDLAVKEAAETAIREVVGQSKMDFVLYEGREQVALNTAKVIQAILDKYKTGIVVSSVTVQNVQPPEQVQAAFDDAVKAGQDRERMKNEGQAYANDVIPRANGTASRLLEEANGYRERVVAQAEGDAARFESVLTEYDKAPKVTRERLYLDTMQQVYSGVSKVLVDSKGKDQLLYLPLDKLMQKHEGATSSSISSAAKGAQAAGNGMQNGAKLEPNAGAGARDALAGRDRGGR